MRLGEAFYREKVGIVQAELERRGLDGLLTLCYPEIYYLAGFFHYPTERPVALFGVVVGHNIVLVDTVHLGTLAMIDYAKSLGTPWKALHIEIHPDTTEKVLQKWGQYVGKDNPPLTIVPSPFRQLIQPLHEVLQKELAENPEGYINVILGHLVMDTYWEQGLHQNSQMIVDLTLQNLPRVAVTKIPYQIHHTHITHSEAHSDAGR